MNKNEILEISCTDIGTINRLINYFETCHRTELCRKVPIENADAYCEHKRLIGRLGGAVSSLKDLRDNLDAAEK